ncbi:hypothetical protein C8R45DRAFT_927918 [Mycena sanguinolenta]|nr:hypothetical protein C8R45DRAFT_927918 [Mycena sanguinolenta]
MTSRDRGVLCFNWCCIGALKRRQNLQCQAFLTPEILVGGVHRENELWARLFQQDRRVEGIESVVGISYNWSPETGKYVSAWVKNSAPSQGSIRVRSLGVETEATERGNWSISKCQRDTKVPEVPVPSSLDVLDTPHPKAGGPMEFDLGGNSMKGQNKIGEVTYLHISHAIEIAEHSKAKYGAEQQKRDEFVSCVEEWPTCPRWEGH